MSVAFTEIEDSFAMLEDLSRNSSELREIWSD